jgi:uncharacterized protein
MGAVTLNDNLKGTMKSFSCIFSVLVGIGFSACDNQNRLNATNQNVNNVIKPENNMKNIVSIIEIPTSDFSRAVAFYKTILNVAIEEINMEGTQMGVLPSDGKTVSVVLVKGIDYQPTSEGTVVYFNAGDDLQPTLDKIEQNGGKVIVPKTQISPEIGFFSLFVDTEGNKLGLHSTN